MDSKSGFCVDEEDLLPPALSLSVEVGPTGLPTSSGCTPGLSKTCSLPTERLTLAQKMNFSHPGSCSRPGSGDHREGPLGEFCGQHSGLRICLSVLAPYPFMSSWSPQPSVSQMGKVCRPRTLQRPQTPRDRCELCSVITRVAPTYEPLLPAKLRVRCVPSVCLSTYLPLSLSVYLA